jgi:hypothetical protein
MIVIRNEQLDSLKQNLLDDFKGRAHDHLRQIYPQETSELGDQPLQEFIRYGIKRAEVNGIQIEADVIRYLEYMIYFDRDFDTDRRFYWAGDILRDDSYTETEKMNQIDLTVGYFTK